MNASRSNIAKLLRRFAAGMLVYLVVVLLIGKVFSDRPPPPDAGPVFFAYLAVVGMTWLLSWFYEEDDSPIRG